MELIDIDSLPSNQRIFLSFNMDYAENNVSVPETKCVEAFTLNVDKSGNGHVTSGDGSINCGETCSAAYNEGSEVVLSSSPDDNWTFDEGWSGDVPDNCDGETDDCPIIMDKDKTVEVEFTEEETEEEANLDVTVNCPEAISIDETATCTIEYANTGSETTDGFGTRLESNGTFTGASGDLFNCDDLPISDEHLGCGYSDELESGETTELLIDIEPEDIGSDIMTVKATGSAANADEASDTADITVED